MKRILNIFKTTAPYAIILMVGLLLGRFFYGGAAPEHEAQGHSHGQTVAATEYTCSMHPQIRQSEPGNCPLCGMALIPASQGEAHSGHVSLSADAQALAQVETSEVTANEATKTLTLSGRLSAAESQQFTQTAHFSGRIERLLVHETGQYVQQGQTIAMLYSPQLVTAQQELLEAQKWATENPALAAAARQKLLNWKLSPQQIDALLARGTAQENFPLLANHSGYVGAKLVNEGDHVQEGQALLAITNLATVWAVLEAYEADLPWLALGDSLRLTLPGTGGQALPATISYIAPAVDPATRSAEVRAELANPSGTLRPDMLVEATVTHRRKSSNGSISAQAAPLVVPRSAVLWTGERSVVYVVNPEDPTAFALRSVTLGPAMETGYSVTEGLEAGERVVTHGAFVVDAAAQLAGRPSMMNAEHAAETPLATTPQQGPVALDQDNLAPLEGREPLPEAHAKALQTLLQAYLTMKDELVLTSATTSQAEAAKVLSAAKALPQSLEGNGASLWQESREVLLRDAAIMANHSEVAMQRRAFITLSEAAIALAQSFETPMPLYVQHCPMANDDTGANWLSDTSAVRNPYFGDLMLTCGWVSQTLEE